MDRLVIKAGEERPRRKTLLVVPAFPGRGRPVEVKKKPAGTPALEAARAWRRVAIQGRAAVRQMAKADPGAPSDVRGRVLARRARGGKPAWKPDVSEGQKRVEAKRRGKQYGRALRVALVGWKRPEVGMTRKDERSRPPREGVRAFLARVGKGVPVGDARRMAGRTPKLVETYRRRDLSPAMRETLSVMDPVWRSPSTAGVSPSDLSLRPVTMKPTDGQARQRLLVRVGEDDEAAAARWADSVLRRKRAKEPKDQHVDALPTSRGSLGGEGR